MLSEQTDTVLNFNFSLICAFFCIVVACLIRNCILANPQIKKNLICRKESNNFQLPPTLLRRIIIGLLN